MRGKGSSTQYGRPQVAGLQKFAKFPAGESVTPRGGSKQQTVILTSLPIESRLTGGDSPNLVDLVE